MPKFSNIHFHPSTKKSIFKAAKCKGAYETSSAVLQSTKILHKMLVESIKLHFWYGSLTFSKCFEVLKRSPSLRNANYREYLEYAVSVCHIFTISRLSNNWLEHPQHPVLGRKTEQCSLKTHKRGHGPRPHLCCHGGQPSAPVSFLPALDKQPEGDYVQLSNMVFASNCVWRWPWRAGTQALQRCRNRLQEPPISYLI